MTYPATTGASEERGLGSGDFRRIADFAFSHAGLSIPTSKQAMVETRLERCRARTGHPTISAYLDFLETTEGKAEIEWTISALTTNVTHFFREAHHFDTVRKDVLPELVQRSARGQAIRLWSAGCSSGEEPFSLAMTVLQAIPDAPTRDIRILATDIDRRILQRASAGLFDSTQVKSVPKEALKRHFSVEEGRYRISADLRRMVTFRQLNLIEPWPMKRRFDVIFCRNVLIYFDRSTQDRLRPRFEAALSPGGWLFLGHSERLAADRGSRLQPSGVTTYRLTGPGLPRSAISNAGEEKCH